MTSDLRFTDVLSGPPIPPDAMFRRMQLPEAAVSAAASLHSVTIGARVVEEFRPLCDSLEWQLAADYWERTGVSPFVDNSVPNLINNNGGASERAAAVLYAAALENDETGSIVVVELGAGSGLFARYFLDAFRALCEAYGKPWYSRLRYVVTDRSRRTVEDWIERDLFAGHRGRVITAVCDAGGREPPAALDGVPVDIPAPWLVVCNYVLDVLPAAIVRTGKDGPEQIVVRTHLMAGADSAGNVELDHVRSLAAEASPAAREQLCALLPALEFETAWRPVGAPGLPHLTDALELGQGLERVLLNHAALDAVEYWLDKLAPAGAILVRDYGPVEIAELATHAAPQRFGGSTAVGLAFPLLECHFRRRGCEVLEPSGDAQRSIHVRLVRRDGGPLVAATFNEQFGAAAEQFSEQPFLEAIDFSRTGRNDDALQRFQLAVERNPRNWFIVGSAAEFVSLQLRDFPSGAELARAAIELNPYYSAWLWNVLGDTLYCMQRFADAHEAYLQAARIDADDPRTNLNLAYTHLQRAEIAAALHAIARGLAHDRDAVFRDRLLEKQQDVLASLSARSRAEQERLVKRALAFQ